jgi:hypothetical protein
MPVMDYFYLFKIKHEQLGLFHNQKEEENEKTAITSPDDPLSAIESTGRAYPYGCCEA